MSRHTKTLRMGGKRTTANRAQAADVRTELKVVEVGGAQDASIPAKDDDARPASTSSDEVPVARITARTLERYLATAELDREAAEERADRTILRFTRLTTAMVGVTMLIAGVNVAMMFRQSNVPQPAVLAPPVAVVPPAAPPVPVVPPALRPVIVQPTPPAPPPPAPARPARLEPARATPAPAPERIRLLGKPHEQATARASAPVQDHLARAAIKPAPFRQTPTVASAGSPAIELAETSRVERW